MRERVPETSETPNPKSLRRENPKLIKVFRLSIQCSTWAYSAAKSIPCFGICLELASISLSVSCTSALLGVLLRGELCK
ncbi:hypothetical protein VNO80_08853 [Phaseolus coccineus]|uniref:Uncharacterized protein n=1 Tax=Phaseolus coccineus TaxID=3886 RepID=A0AAN9N5N4_PHACN